MTALNMALTPPAALRRSGRIVLLALILFTFGVFAIGLGSSNMSFQHVLLAILGEGARTDTIIVWSLRMPRVLMAMLAGAALALAGLTLQRATRNALAAPSVLGIADGAALGVMLFLFLFSNESNALTVSILWQPLAAAAGAMVFALAVVIFAIKTGATPLRIILYGVTLGALAKAGVTLLMIDGPVHRASQAAIWLAGSVHQARWSDVTTLSAVLAILAPLTLLMARRMDQLQLDEQSAAATGLPVRMTQFMLFGLATCLTAATVSFAGALGFVGLVAPHAARLAISGRALPQAIAAALLGAIMVVGADLVVRLAFAPLEVPAGAITAIVGAPYFLFILLRAGRVHA